VAFGVRSSYGVSASYGVRANVGVSPDYGTGDDSPITDFDVNAGTSTVGLSASSIEEGESLTVTIVARNAAGQALAGKAITSVTVDPSTGISVTGSGNTNGSGIATRTITATTAGASFTVTVVCDGVSITQEPTFAVTEPAPPTGASFDGDAFDDAAFSGSAFALSGV
jgi:hypothetical protein